MESIIGFYDKLVALVYKPVLEQDNQQKGVTYIIYSVVENLLVFIVCVGIGGGFCGIVGGVLTFYFGGIGAIFALPFVLIYLVNAVIIGPMGLIGIAMVAGLIEDGGGSE